MDEKKGINKDIPSMRGGKWNFLVQHKVWSKEI